MIQINNDIINIIVDFLDFRSQINLKEAMPIKITNMYVPHKLSVKITDTIIRKNIFIEKLNLYCNTHVTNINFLEKLTVLNISGNCNLNIDHIYCNKIITLNISNNIKIADLSKFILLENLIMDGICRVDIGEIFKLKNLKYLSIVDNPIKKKIEKLKLNIDIQYYYKF